MSDKKDTLHPYYKHQLHTEPEDEVQKFIDFNSMINKDQKEVYDKMTKLRQFLGDKPELSQAIEGYNWDTDHDWNKGVPQYGNDGDSKANEQIKSNSEIGNLVNKLRGRPDFEDSLPTSGKEFPESADGLFSEYPSRDSDLEYAKMIQSQRKMTKDYDIPSSLAPLNSLGEDETAYPEEAAKKRFQQILETIKNPIK